MSGFFANLLVRGFEVFQCLLRFQSVLCGIFNGFGNSVFVSLLDFPAFVGWLDSEVKV